MRVDELIELLKLQPPHATVLISDRVLPAYFNEVKPENVSTRLVKKVSSGREQYYREGVFKEWGTILALIVCPPE